MTEATLFDVDVALVEDEPALELRSGDDCWASCRFCQVLSTAAGIVRHEHGPGSLTCERYRNWSAA